MSLEENKLYKFIEQSQEELEQTNFSYSNLGLLHLKNQLNKFIPKQQLYIKNGLYYMLPNQIVSSPHYLNDIFLFLGERAIFQDKNICPIGLKNIFFDINLNKLIFFKVTCELKEII